MLRPSVIVEYDRSAYVYDWGNTRITFDRNVRSSTDFIGFVHGNTCNYHTVIYDSKQTVELRLLSGQHTIYLNVIDSEAEKDRYMNKSKEAQKMHQTKSPAIHFPDLTVFGLIDMFQSDIAGAYNRIYHRCYYYHLMNWRG